MGYHIDLIGKIDEARKSLEVEQEGEPPYALAMRDALLRLLVGWPANSMVDVRVCSGFGSYTPDYAVVEVKVILRVAPPPELAREEHQ
jgi:hypothetical protein